MTTPIEIYGRDGCGYCKRAQMLCENRGYPFVYRNTTGAPTEFAEMLRRNPLATTVPQIFIGDQLIGGYDDLAARPKLQIQQMIGE